MLWFEQHVTMTPEFSGEIAQALSIPTTARICGIVMLIVGVILIAWTPISRLLAQKRRDAVKDNAGTGHQEKTLLQQNLTAAILVASAPEKDPKLGKTIAEAHPLIECKMVRLADSDNTKS